MDFDKWFDTGGKDKLLEIGGTAISMVPQYTLRAIGKMVWTAGLDCRECGKTMAQMIGTCNCDGKVANTGYCALHDRHLNTPVEDVSHKIGFDDGMGE